MSMDAETRRRINPDSGFPAGFLTIAPRERVAGRVAEDARLTERLEHASARLSFGMTAIRGVLKDVFTSTGISNERVDVWVRPHRRLDPRTWAK